MNLSNHKYILTLLCFLLLVLVACQSQTINPNPQPDPSFSNEGLVGYEKIAVQPEDLGWPYVSYAFVEAPEWLTAPKAEEAYTSDLSPFYNPINPKTGYLLVHDPFGISQFIDVFENEADAIEEIEKSILGTRIKSEYPPNFTPQLDNIRFECRPTGDGPTSCNIVMQYDRFLTNAGMEIGGDKTTFEDWENFMIAMQHRLIIFVEEEPNNQ